MHSCIHVVPLPACRVESYPQALGDEVISINSTIAFNNNKVPLQYMLGGTRVSFQYNTGHAPVNTRVHPEYVLSGTRVPKLAMLAIPS